MSKSITDADQLARIARSDIAPLYLIKLVQYSDKENLTVADTHYISKRALSYKYGAGATQFFKPWLEELGELRSSLTHMPGGVGSGITSKELDIVLENANYGGSRVATLLTAEVLEGATIEVAELLVAEQTAPPIDLTAYTGDEHTIIYRGVITRRVITTERIQLFCTTEFYKYEWPTILDPALAAPRDVGLRYPVPYGSGVEVLCPSHTVGWVTTLASPIADDTFTGNVSVRDASGFAGSFELRIGAESEMTASYVDATTINITARGANASAHPNGASVLEVVSEAIYVAAVEASTVNKLSVRHPATGELIEVTSGYSITLADEAISPAGTTIRFTANQLRWLASLLEAQQPVVTHVESGSEAGGSPHTATGGTLGSASRDGNTGTFATLYNTTGQTSTFTLVASMTSQELAVYIGYIPNLHTLEIYKGSSVTPANKIATVSAGTYNSWFYWTPPGYTGDVFTFHTHAIFADPVTIAEVRRREFTGGGSAVQSTPSESLADSLSLNLELYADLDGPLVPVETVQVTDLDDTTGWNTDNCAHSTDAGDKAEGDRSQVMTVDTNHDTAPSVAAACDSLTGWVTNGVNIQLSGTKTEGTNSIRMVSTGGGTPVVYHTTIAPSTDLTASGDDGHLLILIDIANSVTNPITDDLLIRIGSSTSHWDGWWIPVSDIASDWCTVIIDYTSTPHETGGSGLTATDWNYIALYHNDDTVNATLYWDNIRTIRAYVQIQKNDYSTLDFTEAGPGIFPTYFKINHPQVVDQILIRHSSTAGSGTAIPANHNWIKWASSQFPGGTGWNDLNSFLDGIGGSGSPTPAATQTLQIELQLKGPCVIDQSSSDDWEIELKIDDIKRSIAPTVNWVAVGGELIEHPCDVARHWISVIGDRTADETTFGTAETNLGDNELAVDMRGLGTNWIECLDGLSYISRANFIGEEATAGVVWKMLTAESDYTWPVTGGTLDQFREENFVDAGRDENLDLFSGRTFFYGYLPSLGTGDEAFTKLIRIGADHNDASGDKVPAAIVTAAVAAFGRVDAPVALLLGVSSEDTALELGGYYYTEGARLAALFVVSDLSWSQGYTLECGDIRDLVRPWETGTINVRVIEVSKDFGTQLVEVRLVEVT